jgi:NDP-sugar pyrophosphorylase family protein
LIKTDIALIMNGDSYTDIDLRDLAARHRSTQADVTLVVNPPDGRGDCGSVYASAGCDVVQFAEKQSSANAPYINAGIYIVARTLLHELPAGIASSLERELFPKWLQEGRRLKIFTSTQKCVDIGTPERYQSAQDILASVEQGSWVPNCEGRG